MADAVIIRILSSVAPHPELGKPRPWSIGVEDRAVGAMPWPLPRAEDAQTLQEAEICAEQQGGVVQLLKRGRDG